METVATRLSQTFAVKLFQTLPGINSHNTCISPLSLQSALLMAAYGAGGTTREQIARALDIEPLADESQWESWRTFFQSVHELPCWMRSQSNTGNAMTEDKISKFEVASSLWVDANIGLRPEYRQLCTEKFAATALEVDFKSRSAEDEINTWARERTRGTIPTLVSHLGTDTLAVLANAVYFHGNWKSPFKPDLTSDQIFACVEGDKHVPMMKQTKFSVYSETEHLQWTRLAYEDPRFAMYLFLPNPGQSFAAVYDCLQQPEWSAKQSEVELTLSLPRFKFGWGASVKPNLKQLGIEEAFSERADFSRIATKPVRLTEAIHKTFVQVDEVGTEASAATALLMAPSGCGPQLARKQVEMRFERPFIFMLAHAETMIPIFVGAVNDPSKYD